MEPGFCQHPQSTAEIAYRHVTLPFLPACLTQNMLPAGYLLHLFVAAQGMLSELQYIHSSTHVYHSTC